MPNTTFRLLKWSAAGMISAVFMWACDNDPASIGLDTLPATDVLNANSVSTNFYGEQTQPERVASDHMAVNQPRLPLGELNDPLAGYTRADFITQINLGEKTPVFSLRCPHRHHRQREVFARGPGVEPGLSL